MNDDNDKRQTAPAGVRVAEFVVSYNMKDSRGRERHYSRDFSDRAAAVAYARQKDADGRVLSVSCYFRDAIETPQYTDGSGVFHCASSRASIQSIKYWID